MTRHICICPSAVALVPLFLASLLASSLPVLAANTGGISGTVSTSNTEVLLPGVEVALVDVATGLTIRTAYSDGAGHYRFDGVGAGQYRVLARLSGFIERHTGTLVITPGLKLDVPLVLELVPVSETVTVRGEAGVARRDDTASTESIDGKLVDVLPVGSDSYRALLPVLPGVVRQPDGRISVKGARPTQGALNIGAGSGVDPSTGNFGVELPSDAVDTVDVVPNPYAAEDGRFSASVVRVETRAGTSAWRVTANSFVPAPCLTLCDGYSIGIRNYNPRLWVGGPLVKDRVFVSQALEYRLTHARIPSLPDPDNLQRSDSFDAFTRVDIHPAPGHALTAMVAFFPRRLQRATMNTFNPEEVSPDFRSSGYNLAISESATLSPTTLLASFFSVSQYDGAVTAHSTRDMQLTVEGNRGGYFNQQDRSTRAYQWSETLTLSRPSRVGEHLFKLGLNVLRASYTGTSDSRPVIARRPDGTVSWRQDFGAETIQRAGGTDVAVFAQDRWRPGSRVLLDAGLRLDRDGVLGRTAVSPRLGAVVSLLAPDVAMLRGGAGLFYERTPLNVAAFESFEAATITRFAADGVTPVSAEVTWSHRSAALDTPRAFVWNLEYDQRLGRHVFLKLNHLRRSGSREFVVEPVSAAGATHLLLDSSGRSHYQETEVSLRVGQSDERQVTASYVRSSAAGDLNAYDLYFGTFRLPVIQPNQYSVAPVDVPNRLLIKGVLPLGKAWTASTLLEVRNGFPFSIIDENQAFVGVRNAGGRFPALCTLDASVLRTARVLGQEIRFGIRVFHLLNAFAPRDVQNNIDSPSFGTFYNGLIRRVMFTVQFTAR